MMQNILCVYFFTSAVTALRIVAGPEPATNIQNSAEVFTKDDWEHSGRSFGDMVRDAGFNWTDFLDAKGWPKKTDQITVYLELLMKHRRQFGRAPIMVSTRPDPLENPFDCRTPDFFQGPRKQGPAWIVMILPLAWEVDMLEVQLYELDGIVDEFVVFEGTHTQRGAPKPLVFEGERERFKRFLPKIRHYVQLPNEVKFKRTIDAPKGQSWVNEDTRTLAYRRYVAEETSAGRSLNNTLFVNADIDEIPPPEGVWRFKHCHTKRLWATFCSVTYQPDLEHIQEFPDFGGKLGNHYWPHPNILREGEKLRGTGNHVYDEALGMHLHVRDPWSEIAKQIGTAEIGVIKLKRPEDILNPMTVYSQIACDLLERKKYNGEQHQFKRMPAAEFKHQKRLPWFMQHNKARFPYAWPSLFPMYSNGTCLSSGDSSSEFFKF